MRDTAELELTMAAFARSANSGMIVTAGGTGFRRDLIIRLAFRHELPAVYPFRYYATDGGLISYGPDTLDPVRRATEYVDRILKGEKLRSVSHHTVHDALYTYSMMQHDRPDNRSPSRKVPDVQYVHGCG